jgi:ATP-dependent Clp protease protease subunit
MQEAVLDQLLNEGVDAVRKCIYFGSMSDKSSDFEWNTVEFTVRALHALSSINSDPITIHMNSTGGSEMDMMRLYDEIMTCPVPVHFVGGGSIMSAAVWIMSACDHRALHKHAVVMIHEGSGGVNGEATHVDQNIEMDLTNHRNNLLWKILANNSKLSYDFWKKAGQRDLYITADEALEIGLIDAVIEHPDRSEFRRERTSNLAKRFNSKKKNLIESKFLQRVKM